MIDRIRSFFKARGQEQAGAGPSSRQKEFAAAALMVEAARIDGRFEAVERAKIEDILRRRFRLGEAECTALLAAAEAAQEEANHLLRFTRAIKDSFPLEERVEMIEMLWEVVCADGKVDAYESNLLRRVGGLIYVSERERGAARKRVMARLATGSGRA